MDDITPGLLKDIDRLVKSLITRIAFWPPVEGHETEKLKMEFARMLTEKYIEILGPTTVSDILRTSTTDLEILESLTDELDLKEIREQEYLLDEERVTMRSHDTHFR